MQPHDAYTLLSLAGDVRGSRTLRDIISGKTLLLHAMLEQVS